MIMKTSHKLEEMLFAYGAVKMLWIILIIPISTIILSLAVVYIRLVLILTIGTGEQRFLFS